MRLLVGVTFSSPPIESNNTAYAYMVYVLMVKFDFFCYHIKQYRERMLTWVYALIARFDCIAIITAKPKRIVELCKHR